jgi:twitching motility protein PilT
MSAIVSLLRVMTLRDAEAIVLEPGKVPTLRRRGLVEALAMPALEPAMLASFAEPLLAGQSLEGGPVMVSFTDADVTYPVTIEQTASGLRLVVRRPAPKKAEKKENYREDRRDREDRREEPSPKPSAASEVSAASAVTLPGLLASAVAVAQQRGASDLFLSTGQGARIKVDGRLETIELHVDDDALAAAVREIAHGGSADLSMELDGVRLRVNAFMHLDGAAIAARLIREHVPGLAELGLPPELASIVDLRDGLVLVCGPTGSGKSTTLASLIDLLDQRRAAHVITLEDPIEYRFTARRCLIHQRELGTHMQSFAEGLRAALREAPDVILLGELRDKETITAALTAAETGHLVLATLHAPNAVGAVDRLIDTGAPAGRLGACLKTIVTQYLVPRKDGGRAVAAEVVPVTAAVGNIIRKGELQTLPTAIQSGRDAGMIPLERSLARLAESGAVAPAVIKKFAADHDLLASLAGKLR